MFLVYASQKWWESAFTYFDAGAVVCVVLVYLFLCAFVFRAQVSEGLDYTNVSGSSSARRCFCFTGPIYVFTCCLHSSGIHSRSRIDF